ncbi:DUF1028 domain-containing protein [Photobacterium gaetbulicola]|uniref:Major pilin protein fimA n=1 Tax=Photobacterium gaetbulicola Gung47 TaxID=658445 RepID=A0A0C5WQ47_9GAMM|nr:DUF1028 domain-containing protein [Photobacterium gaetbulicola]AJR05080.1 hypothetical protein H744_1c0047 [Photobacterium gaetbulicola Gung47]PSU06890.1 DUF1028 domain-containing protein [Photobacterium gaetbulicola]
MTISLIHFNPETGTAASITATGGVSVGGYVNHSWRGLGGCATQGLFTNPWYAEKAKQLLGEGLNCREVIERLKSEDAGFEQRQCLVMDRNGNADAINGGENIPYIGAVVFQHIAVAGNMLESERVLQRFAESFVLATCANAEQVLAGSAAPCYCEGYESSLPEALILALEAALEAGGDKRGTYSASLRVESMTQAPVDIRVDWSDDSLIADMRKVLGHVRGDSFQQFLAQLPNR